MARPDEEDRTRGDGEPITLREFDVAVVPYFMGSDCIEGFLQWVADIEEIFDSIAILEEKMVEIVASSLEDDVAFWWDQLRKSRKQQGKNPISSWRWMKRLLVKKFFPFEYNIYLLRNGYKIVQPNIMVGLEKMEEVLEKEETVMDAILIEDPIIHKMKEEIQEKQDIEPNETPVVVETYMSKDEEQQLDSSEIKGMDESVFGEENNSYKEFDSHLAYSNLVYGINYMIIPSKYEQVLILQIEEFIYTSSSMPTQVHFNENSRSSSLQVKESDVGRNMVTYGTRKRRKAYRWDFLID